MGTGTGHEIIPATGMGFLTGIILSGGCGFDLVISDGFVPVVIPTGETRIEKMGKELERREGRRVGFR